MVMGSAKDQLKTPISAYPVFPNHLDRQRFEVTTNIASLNTNMENLLRSIIEEFEEESLTNGSIDIFETPEE